MATGWVAGAPLPNGFSLRTEADRVIFVATDQDVSAGDEVRVAGPLAAREALEFEGGEVDAFEEGFETEGDVETFAYIDACTVTRVGASQDTGAAPMSNPSSDTMSGTSSSTVDGTDPGSRSG